MTSYSNVSDENLIQQFAQGDLAAFESLYNRHVKTVYNRVRYRIPQIDVEDVTQDVFLAVLCSLPTFRGEAQFTTWLRTLTNHKVAEYYRRRSRKKETIQVDLIQAEEHSDQSSASSLEDQIILQNALKSIQNRYREVILLRFAEGMRFNEIAKFRKRNPEAIKSLFRRAIAALREKMEVKNEQTSK